MSNQPQKIDHERLIQLATEARKEAYAAYSDFSVGAALLTESGEIYTGCNVENASYPLSMCAERIAVFKAVSAGETDFAAIAIVTDSGATPCGACRQVLTEFNSELRQAQKFQVIVANTEGDSRVFPLDDLLPGAFTSAQLSSY